MSDDDAVWMFRYGVAAVALAILGETSYEMSLVYGELTALLGAIGLLCIISWIFINSVESLYNGLRDGYSAIQSIRGRA